VVSNIPTAKLGYNDLIRAGIFCPLGEGQVEFTAIADELRAAQYDGWLIVEQDVIVGDSGQRATSLEAAQQSRAFLRALLGT